MIQYDCSILEKKTKTKKDIFFNYIKKVLKLLFLKTQLGTMHKKQIGICFCINLLKIPKGKFGVHSTQKVHTMYIKIKCIVLKICNTMQSFVFGFVYVKNAPSFARIVHK